MLVLKPYVTTSSKYGTFYLGLLTEASYLMPQIFSSVLVPKEGHACRDCSVAQGLTKQAFALQLHCGSRKHALQMGAEQWLQAESKDRVWEAHLQGLKMRLRVLELIVYYFSIIVCLAVSVGTLGGAPLSLNRMPSSHSFQEVVAFGVTTNFPGP